MQLECSPRVRPGHPCSVWRGETTLAPSCLWHRTVGRAPQSSLSTRGHSHWGRVRTASTDSRTSWVSQHPHQCNTPMSPGVALWSLLRLSPLTQQDRKVSMVEGAAAVGKCPHPRASLPSPPLATWLQCREQLLSSLAQDQPFLSRRGLENSEYDSKMGWSFSCAVTCESLFSGWEGQGDRGWGVAGEAGF